MKRNLFSLFLCAFLSTALMAQEVVVKRATVDPVLDGLVDAVWTDASVNNIDLPFGSETPTLGVSGETTWQALWSDNGIFVLIKVKDDIFSPLWAGTDGGYENWMYDKPEIYFDVNEILADGIGASTQSTHQGHFQCASDPVEANIETGIPFTSDEGVISAFLVTDPTYVVEYFVPFTKLKDKNGAALNKEAPIGFDVYIIDNDTDGPDRQRQVWANDGTKGAVTGEAWISMDGCGTITLDGTNNVVLVTDITLSSAGNATTIQTEGGTLQMSATVLPSDASSQGVMWTVDNGTGRATISSTGLLTAVLNGTVTVLATSKDGSNIENYFDITISNQFVSMSDINCIKNGNFDTDGGLPAFWEFWSGNGGTGPLVIEGVVNCAPVLHGYTWQYQFNQSGLTAFPDVEYVFSFVAWADADRDIQIDFEDTPANGRNRYGTDVETGSVADWTFGITAVPTRYTYHVIFDKMVPTTIQKVLFMLSAAPDVVYLDSISLVSVTDLPLLSGPGVGVQKNKLRTLNVFPNPVTNQLNVNLVSANSQITIYNNLGRKMEEVIVKGNKTTFDVSSYASGLYFVKVNNDTIVKFVK